MLSYNEYEKAIFDWLMGKHHTDRDFTFSVRQKAMKGSETDYFIGTKTSMYFGTTFWTIPVYYPGSSTDLIDLFFKYTDDNLYTYYFEFTQAKNRPEKQNKLAIKLLNQIKPKIKEEFQLLSETGDEHKMETFRIRSRKDKYDSIEALINDVDSDLDKIFPIVQAGIENVKNLNSDFEAHRITPDEFNMLIEKLNKRLIKYQLAEEVPPTISIVNPYLNQILYGPPGTGKTFRSIRMALELLNDDEEKKLDWEDWDAVKELYDRRINEGRIGFVTFHQSMSYEDFIEGIKPMEPSSSNENISYMIQDGIFKTMCLAASNRNNINFEVAYSKLIEDLKSKENGISINDPNIKIKINLSENGFDLDVESNTYIKKINKTGLKYVSESQRFVGTWGKNYKAIFKLLADNFGYKTENENVRKNYVLIIDEINRGNVAQIFGELITLIEDTKRKGSAEALKVMLPYSKKYFEVPDNLFLLGTMNTADRSVEALDTALRRRFAFTEMFPRPDLLISSLILQRIFRKYDFLKYDDLNWLKIEKDILELLGGVIIDKDKYEDLGIEAIDNEIYSKLNGVIEFSGINLEQLLTIINLRIEKLLDKDHQIGHSYFMSVYSITDLKVAFQNKIIPLLQEYFFGDYGKIGLVLGKGFVEKKPKQTVFAEFDPELASELSEKTSYTIKNVIQMTDVEFRAAIDLLVGNK
jgi:5-methylcytosine-specific restriction protein B